jgi:hypothetical protein
VGTARGKVVAGIIGAVLLVPLFGAAAAPPVPCSWPFKLDADTLNTAFPDQSATYWGTRFVGVPGARIVVRGRYPDARYFSLHAYDDLQRPVGSLADRDIIPDAGSLNPFVTPGAVAGGTYTAYVAFTGRPATPASNTLYAGAMTDGTPNPSGFMLYRVYVPDDPADQAGGVGVPDLSLELPGGVEIPFGRCTPLPPSTGGAITDAIAQASFPDAVPRSIPFPPDTTTPQFRRFYGLDRNVWDRVPPNQVTDPLPRFQGGFLSNQHIAYLYKILSRQHGDVFAFRAKAPTFPDTRAGVDPTTPSQVRYWSICENELATQRFVGCLADYQSVIGDDGFFTFVISDPADRPANATVANKINWIPWGGVFYDGLVIYRHMLPAADFAQAVQNVPEGADAATIMGDYFPRGGYCTKARFEARGIAGCTGAG